MTMHCLLPTDARDQEIALLRQRVHALQQQVQQLTPSHRWIRTLLERLPYGRLLIYDKTLRYVEAGDTRGHYPIPRHDLIGRTIWDVFAPDIAAMLEAPYRAALVGREATIQLAFAGGVYRVHTLPVYDATGQIDAGMAVFIDITAQIVAEEQLTVIHDQLYRLATTDGLTQVLNRRAFMEHLGAVAAHALHADTDLSLLLLDVDHFKAVNDTFGHLAGDAILQTLGEILRGHCRRDDVVARYGGEEFVLLLPHTDLVQASTIAERVRSAIAMAWWPQRPITISVGVACLNAAVSTDTALLQAADQALYQAKRRGRNCVVWETHHTADNMRATN